MHIWRYLAHTFLAHHILAHQPIKMKPQEFNIAFLWKYRIKSLLGMFCSESENDSIWFCAVIFHSFLNHTPNLLRWLCRNVEARRGFQCDAITVVSSPKVAVTNLLIISKSAVCNWYSHEPWAFYFILIPVW